MSVCVCVLCHSIQFSDTLNHISRKSLSCIFIGSIFACGRAATYLDVHTKEMMQWQCLSLREPVCMRPQDVWRSSPFRRELEKTHLTLPAEGAVKKEIICICIGLWLSPSLLRVSSFVSFCWAVTFGAVKPLPEFSFSDSLLMTEPSSLGNLLQVTIATGKAVSSRKAGQAARLCHSSL